MRWRLTAPHYLNVSNRENEWEYKETDRNTGRQARKVFIVPVHLDPENPGDQNSEDGVVVAHESGTHNPRDILFSGEPTPDMEPLDDEAQKLSDSLRHKWQHPIESLPGQGGDYGAALIKSFEAQMATLLKQGGAVSTKGISESEFEEMKAQMKTLTEQNAALMEQLRTKPDSNPRRA